MLIHIDCIYIYHVKNPNQFRKLALVVSITVLLAIYLFSSVFLSFSVITCPIVQNWNSGGHINCKSRVELESEGEFCDKNESDRVKWLI